jgi:hypothetical protein
MEPAMTLVQRLDITLNRIYLAKLARDPAALGFFLSVSADAEANGEGQVFTHTQAWLEARGQTKLAKLVATHAADEVRHEGMMLADLASLGRTQDAVPEALKMIDRLGERAGNLFDAPVQTAEDVARTYLLLYAVERRAIERFGFMIEALAPVHPEIAATFEQIAKDERTHLHYCVAVSRAAVPDDAAWTALRDEMVALEVEEFTKSSRIWMWHALDNVFQTMSLPEKLVWKTLRSLADLTGRKMEVLPLNGADELPSGRIPARNAIAAAA